MSHHALSSSVSFFVWVGGEEKYALVVIARWKFSQMHRGKPGTGNSKIPSHIQDVKLTWYQMRQKTDFSTGMSSDDKNTYLFKENSKPSIQDIIELPDSDSNSDSSVFIARPPFKKVKQENSINNINTT
eukprot:5106916-Ditylum_brightwellii.AAC.1